MPNAKPPQLPPRLNGDPWGIRLSPAVPPRARLLWCYHAGGFAATIAPWRARLPRDWELLIPEYPGRGVCARLDPLDTVQALADHVARRAPGLDDDLPLILFGHSLGALVAFEVLHRILPRRRRPGTTSLVVSAARTPTTWRFTPPDAPLSDAQVLAALTYVGGTPREILHDAAFRGALLAKLRSDHHAFTGYRWTPRPPLDVPVLALAGRGDPLAGPEDVARWRGETRARFELRVVDGGHFYYADKPGALLDALRSGHAQIGGGDHAHPRSEGE